MIRPIRATQGAAHALRARCTPSVFFLFACLLWPGALQVSGQAGQNQIMGRILTPPNVPVPGSISVSLRLASGSLVGSTDAGGVGRFTFANLVPGDYVVSVKADGYLPAEEQVEIPRGFLRAIINVAIALTPQHKVDQPPLDQDKVIPLKSLTVPQEAAKELARAANEAKRRNYRSAIQHLHKALEINPEYYQAYNNLGVYHYNLGEKEKAVEMFQKALTIHQDALVPHNNLGKIFLELSRPEEALGHLVRAAELNPTSAQTSYRLGQTYIILGRYAESLVPLQRALDRDPPVPHARWLLAQAFYRLGDKARAVQELRRYLKTRPKNRRALEERLRQWESELNPP